MFNGLQAEMSRNGLFVPGAYVYNVPALQDLVIEQSVLHDGSLSHVASLLSVR